MRSTNKKMAMLARSLLELGCPRSLENLFRPSLLPWSHCLARSYPTSVTTAASTPPPLEQTAIHNSRPNGEEATSSSTSSAVAKGPGMALLRKRKWTKLSRRTGLIGIKLGMTQLWNTEGRHIAVTVLQVIDNQVVLVRTKRKEGYYALQVGAIDHPKLKNVLKPVLGQFEKAGVPPKRKLMEFRVTRDALLPVGTKLHVSHFVPGQFVDVCSKSIGKGFQGVMKRHNMKGQPASHGTTKTHRKMGATGGGQDPGRIMPGKRMPGRMGGKRVTTKCLKVYRVNNKFNVLYVRGPVPGHKNTYIRITDAKLKPNFMQAPFPTFLPDDPSDPSATPLPEEVYAKEIHVPHQDSLVFPDKRKQKK